MKVSNVDVKRIKNIMNTLSKRLQRIEEREGFTGRCITIEKKLWGYSTQLALAIGNS